MRKLRKAGLVKTTGSTMDFSRRLESSSLRKQSYQSGKQEAKVNPFSILNGELANQISKKK